MIDRTVAARLLEPLAKPTFEAHARARQQSKSVRSVHAESRALLEPSALALSDGVQFWALWSSLLAHAYGSLPTVRRNPGHPLEHVWTVADTIQLRLKSDVHALSPVQTPIPGLALHSGGFVALSAPVNDEVAFFVGMDGRKVAWRIPVASLISAAATALPTRRPTASMRSRRRLQERKNVPYG